MADTPTDIKRYTQWCAGTHGHGLNEHPVGELVHYEDYVALAAVHLARGQEIAALRAQLATAERELSVIDAVLARRPALDKPTRRENVEHAIATAARADAAEREREKAECERDEMCRAILTHRMAEPTSWLIEQHRHSKVHYWTGRVIGGKDQGQWSHDVALARRFARREDAECMLTWHCNGVGNVVEHLWMAPTPVPTAPVESSDARLQASSVPGDDGQVPWVDVADLMSQTCERCQMRLHENMGTFLPGIRGSMAWRCAACHPIEGASGVLKREEVIRIRKARLAPPTTEPKP